MSNNQTSPETIGLAIVIAVVGLMAIVFYAIACFLALVLTLLCFWAWNKPRTLFGETLLPEEARAFVGAGVFGAFVAPLFVLFCELLFDFKTDDQSWFYIITGGYAFTSLGMGMHQASEAEKRKAASVIDADLFFVPPPPLQPDLDAEPFRFADWDDENAVEKWTGSSKR